VRALLACCPWPPWASGSVAGSPVPGWVRWFIAVIDCMPFDKGVFQVRVVVGNLDRLLASHAG
jgi:hypothetical protein